MIYELEGMRPTLPPDGDYWVAPDARVIGDVTLGHDASIWFGATLRGDRAPITVGEGSNIQDGSVLHVDPGVPCTVGSGVIVGHMVMLHGCTIADTVLIGIGAVVLNGAKIGRGSLVGSNTLITEGKEFPENSLIIGSPGKVVRETTEAERAMIVANAADYVQNWRRFARSLKPL